MRIASNASKNKKLVLKPPILQEEKMYQKKKSISSEVPLTLSIDCHINGNQSCSKCNSQCQQNTYWQKELLAAAAIYCILRILQGVLIVKLQKWKTVALKRYILNLILVKPQSILEAVKVYLNKELNLRPSEHILALHT